MPITCRDNVDGLTEEQLSGFFVGWPTHPDAETHLEILRRGHAVWLAMDADRCVGFINATSDGVFYAHVPHHRQESP